MSCLSDSLTDPAHWLHYFAQRLEAACTDAAIPDAEFRRYAAEWLEDFAA